MKKGVVYCTCCDTVNAVLPADALRDSLAGRALYRTPTAVSPGRRDRNASSAPGRTACVVTVVESPRLCDPVQAEAALRAARDAGAEAVVAAGCSLSARGREGLAYLSGNVPVEWVDVREGCAWVHGKCQQEALAKATDIICMGLSALDHRPSPSGGPRPVREEQAPVLVVGAGPAGLACATTLGSLGLDTILVERRAEPGGLLPQLGKLFPSLSSGDELLRDLRRELGETPVRLETGTAVTAIALSGDGYAASLRGPDGERDIAASAVVLATGAIPVLPKGYFGHGEIRGVSSQMELEVLLARVERGEASAEVLPRCAVFLQCVAARDDKNPYCSAVCCPTALKNALRLRSLVPDGTVTVAHRNIVTPGIHLENLYRQATDAGVALRSIDPDTVPEPVGADRLEGLRVRDALDGRETVLPADCLVCSTPLKPAPGTASLARGLGLRLDDMGFVCGREPILPLTPHLAGIYLCGSVRWPATVEQSLEQGRAAAVRAAAFVLGQGDAPGGPRPNLSWTVRELLGTTGDTGLAARIREDGCSRCGRCASACPYGALNLSEGGPMRVTAPRCGQCGSCAAVCPTGAADLPGRSMAAMRAGIHEALGGVTL